MTTKKMTETEDFFEDVPEEVEELLEAGIPILNFASTNGTALAVTDQTEQEWFLRKYTESYEWLTQKYPVRFSAEFRYRPRKRYFFERLALFLRKDSPNLARHAFQVFPDLCYTYELPAEEAGPLLNYLKQRYDESCAERDYDVVCLDLFRENERGVFEYTEVAFFARDLLLHQNQNTFQINLLFTYKICPVCQKLSIDRFSMGGGICPVCGWCELSLENNIGFGVRKKLYDEYVTHIPNYMLKDPIVRHKKHYCPVKHVKLSYSACYHCEQPCDCKDAVLS